MTVIFQDNQTAFANAIKEVLWQREEATLYGGKPSGFGKDSKGSLVIGYGYDIPSRAVSTVVSDLSAAGLTLSAANVSVLTQYKAGTITADAAKIALEAVKITPDQAETLFNNIKGSYEVDVVNRINSVIDQLVVRGILTSEDKTQWKLEHPGTTLSESAESAILFSLQYNSQAGRELIGEGLVTALVKGDRVGAWYEIRYRSNAERSRGVDQRRLDEANAFGLYSTSSGPSSAKEAISVIEYLVNEKDSIKEYIDSLIITSDERNAKTQELQVNIQRSQEYAADFGLYYVQSSQQSLISLAAATGYSTALLSAINGNRTSFNVGEIVRIPTNVSDLSIAGTSGLSDGSIGGRNIAYAVVNDTDELGNPVRRLVQYTTTEPTEAGTITFFGASGKAIEKFPISSGYGDGQVTLKVQGDSLIASVSIPTGTSALDLPITIDQNSDGSLFKSDGRGHTATYYSSSEQGGGLRSIFTDDQGTVITRNWANNKGEYSENGQKIADVEFGVDSRTYIYKDANGNETKRQTFIKNGPVIEELNHGTPAAVVTSFIDMGGYRLENTLSAAGQSYVYKFNDGTRIAGIIGESFLTKIDPQGNESQIDKESFLPMDYVNLGGPPIATVAPLQIPTCDKLVNFGKDIWSKFTNQNALIDAQGACEIVLEEVDGLIGKAKVVLGEIGDSVDKAWSFSLEYLKSKFDISSSGDEEIYLGELSATMVGEFYSGGERLSALSLELGKKVYSSFAFAGPEQLVLPYDATAQVDKEQGTITFSIQASGNEPGGTYTIDMETGIGTFSSEQGDSVTITESQRFEYLGSGVLRNVDSNGTETTYFPFDPNDSTVVRAVWNYADGSSEQRRWDNTGIGYDSSGNVSASILYTSQGKSLTYLDSAGNPTGTKEFVNSDGSREVTNTDGSGVTYSSQGIRTSEFSVNQTPVEGTITTYIQYDPTGSVPTGAKTIVFQENGAREVINTDGTGYIIAANGGKASDVEIKNGVEVRYLLDAYGNRTGETATVYKDGSLVSKSNDGTEKTYGSSGFVSIVNPDGSGQYISPPNSGDLLKSISYSGSGGFEFELARSLDTSNPTDLQALASQLPNVSPVLLGNMNIGQVTSFYDPGNGDMVFTSADGTTHQVINGDPVYKGVSVDNSTGTVQIYFGSGMISSYDGGDNVAVAMPDGGVYLVPADRYFGSPIEQGDLNALREAVGEVGEANRALEDVSVDPNDTSSVSETLIAVGGLAQAFSDANQSNSESGGSIIWTDSERSAQEANQDGSSISNEPISDPWSDIDNTINEWMNDIPPPPEVSQDYAPDETWTPAPENSGDPGNLVIQIQTATATPASGAVGCFSPETPVLMADGSERPIASVRVNDQVMAFDGLGGLRPKRVIRTLVHDDHELLAFHVNDGGQPIIVTAEHRFLTAEGGYKPVWRLDENDSLVRSDGNLVGKQRLETLPGRHRVYNLTVEDLHTYVAGGMQ